MSSRILIIDQPELKRLQVGADFSSSFSEAKLRVEQQEYYVICAPANSDNLDQLREIGLKNKEKISGFQLILVDQGLSSPETLQLLEGFNIGHICKDNAQGLEDKTLIHLLEKVQSTKQQDQLLQLVSEQQKNLQKTTSELSGEVAENQKSLLQAKERLSKTNKRVDTLKRALMIVHNAKSISDIENLLSSALNMAVDLSSVRIVFQDQIDMIERSFEHSKQQKIFSSELSLSHSFQRGKVFFFRSGQKNFNRDEVSFLNQISDGITLAVDRLIKIQKSETLKQQWEITFDAISDGLCLCDKEFTILRTNKSFVEASQKDFKKLIGQNVFKSFHNIAGPEKTSYSERYTYSSDIKTSDETHSYEVAVHPIELGELYLVAFHDLTEQRRLEKQVFQNSKMLELGSISGSIAHELNNPLGGIISFLQLIKMDISEGQPIYKDVLEMEEAAHRCKTIVENLLGFSRKNHIESQTEVDLMEVVNKAIEIQEIKLRSKNTKIENLLKPSTFIVHGNQNLLTQATMNLLQNALEATADQRDAKITVSGVRKKSSLQLIVEDNGPGIPDKNLSKIFNPLFTTKIGGQNNGLGLTVAFLIFNDHKSQLEITSKEGKGAQAKITFGSLDL